MTSQVPPATRGTKSIEDVIVGRGLFSPLRTAPTFLGTKLLENSEESRYVVKGFNPYARIPTELTHPQRGVWVILGCPGRSPTDVYVGMHMRLAPAPAEFGGVVGDRFYCVTHTIYCAHTCERPYVCEFLPEIWNLGMRSRFFLTTYVESGNRTTYEYVSCPPSKACIQFCDMGVAIFAGSLLLMRGGTEPLP